MRIKYSFSNDNFDLNVFELNIKDFLNFIATEGNSVEGITVNYIAKSKGVDVSEIKVISFDDPNKISVILKKDVGDRRQLARALGGGNVNGKYDAFLMELPHEEISAVRRIKNIYEDVDLFKKNQITLNLKSAILAFEKTKNQEGLVSEIMSVLDLGQSFTDVGDTSKILSFKEIPVNLKSEILAFIIEDESQGAAIKSPLFNKFFDLIDLANVFDFQNLFEFVSQSKKVELLGQGILDKRNSYGQNIKLMDLCLDFTKPVIKFIVENKISHEDVRDALLMVKLSYEGKVLLMANGYADTLLVSKQLSPEDMVKLVGDGVFDISLLKTDLVIPQSLLAKIVDIAIDKGSLDIQAVEDIRFEINPGLADIISIKSNDLDVLSYCANFVSEQVAEEVLVNKIAENTDPSRIVYDLGIVSEFVKSRQIQKKLFMIAASNPEVCLKLIEKSSDQDVRKVAIETACQRKDVDQILEKYPMSKEEIVEVCNFLSLNNRGAEIPGSVIGLHKDELIECILGLEFDVKMALLLGPAFISRNMCEKFKNLKVIEEASVLNEEFALLLYNELDKGGKLKESGILKSKTVMELVSNRQEQKSYDWKIAHSPVIDQFGKLIELTLGSDLSNLVLGLPRIASMELNDVPGVIELRERLLAENDLFLGVIAESSDRNLWDVNQKTAEILAKKIGEVSCIEEELIIRWLIPEHVELVLDKVDDLSDSGFVEFLVWGSQFKDLMSVERQLGALEVRKKTTLSIDSIERIKTSLLQDKIFSAILKSNPSTNTVANMLLSGVVRIGDVKDSFYLELKDRTDLIGGLFHVLRESNKFTELLLGIVDEWDGMFDFGILAESDYAQIFHDATEKQVEKMLVISSKVSNEKMFNCALRMIELSDALRMVEEHRIKVNRFVPTKENANKYFSISAVLQGVSGTYDFKTGALNVNDMGLFGKLGATVKMSPVFAALKNINDELGKVEVIAAVINNEVLIQLTGQNKPSEISSLVKEKKSSWP